MGVSFWMFLRFLWNSRGLWTYIASWQSLIRGGFCSVEPQWTIHVVNSQRSVRSDNPVTLSEFLISISTARLFLFLSNGFDVLMLPDSMHIRLGLGQPPSNFLSNNRSFSRVVYTRKAYG